MKRWSIIVLAIMFVGGLWAAFLPNVKPHLHYLDDRALLCQINAKDRYISVDKVAQMIIEKDPSLLLIDVRSPQQYKEFSLPGALNIPIDSLLLEKNQQLFLNPDVYTVVFYSNGNSLADYAWLITKDAGFRSLYVMEGGLNAWFTKILMPKRPKDWEKQEAFEKYYRRRAYARFFTGASEEESSSSAPKPNIVVPVKKKHVGGGCE